MLGGGFTAHTYHPSVHDRMRKETAITEWRCHALSFCHLVSKPCPPCRHSHAPLYLFLAFLQAVFTGTDLLPPRLTVMPDIREWSHHAVLFLPSRLTVMPNIREWSHHAVLYLFAISSDRHARHQRVVTPRCTVSFCHYV